MVPKALTLPAPPSGEEQPRNLPLGEAVDLAYALVTQIADEHGIRVLGIKGPILSATGLRPPRVSSDADFIVDPARRDELMAALEARGWVTRDARRAEGLLPDHSKTMLHPSWPCDIDLHAYYPGMFAEPGEVFDELWETRTEVEVAHVAIPTPQPTGNALIVWLHGVRNPGSQRHEQEMAAAVQYFRTQDESVRDELRRLVEASRAGSVTAALLREIGLDPVHDLSDAEMTRWEIYRSTNSDGSTSGWLMSLLETPAGRRAHILGRALWPSDAELRLSSFLEDAPRSQLIRFRLERLGHGVRSAPAAAASIWRAGRALRAESGEPVRVVINGRFLTQDITGVQRFAEGVVTELVQRRNDVLIVTPPNALRTIPGAEHLVVGTHGGHRWEQTDLPRFLRAHGSPLLVTLTSTGPAFYGNQVTTHHDITMVRHPQNYSRAFRAVYGILTPQLLRVSKALITVSSFSAHEIGTHYGVDPARFRVVHNAASEQFAPAAESAPRDYLLAVSSDKVNKNFARLVRAYATLRAERPGFPPMRIIGDRNASFAAVERAESEGVEYLGRVSDEELAELYRGALAFAFPSLYEGFGIPPLEAQASGTPVVAARSSSLPEVLGDSALWVDPLDESDIARGLARVVDDADLREELRKRGFENVQRFSWSESANRVNELIDEVL